MDEILLLNVDVSFAATSFALADLARHQTVQERVRQEVDEALQGTDPSSYAELDKKLPYMEMVLKESARMNPALALSLPERTVKPVTEIGGFQIPKGVRDLVCVFVNKAISNASLLLRYDLVQENQEGLFFLKAKRRVLIKGR